MNDQTLKSHLRHLAEQSDSVSKNTYDTEQNLQKNGTLDDFQSFSHSVAHDLRSSLRSINGFAKMLADDKSKNLDEEGKEYLKIIRENTLRMDRLFDDLLKLSRYYSTRTLQKESVNMGNMVAEIMRGVKYEGEIYSGNMKTAFADPVLLKQLWANLISNAIKFSSKKEIAVIEIGCRQVNHETVYFIKDNGAGFDMKYAGKLFTVFQRMHNEREFPGAGVGLAIVHRIVTRHGGKIWAEAEVDKGAAIYFTLSS